MSASLDTPTNEFEGLRQGQVRVLVKVLRGTEVTAREHLRRRYNEEASGFDETFAFLTAIGGVKSVDGLPSLHPALASIEPDDDAGISRATLCMLAESSTPYRREMRGYLGRFRVKQGAVVYRPSEQARSAESAVRNYLIDLGVVEYDSIARRYVILPQHSGLYAESVHPHRRMSPAQLKTRLLACEALGFRAEEEVVAYERGRVGSRFEHEVQHVAAQDVAAGYDVLSVTVGGEGNITPRYIEVKAVPPETWRFYWTANELVMAETFASWYYLYLVPSGPSGYPDIAGVRILADPFSAVLSAGSEWTVERGVVRCYLDPLR